MKWVFLILSLFALGAASVTSLKDDLGNHVQLKKPAKRILSLAPDITEILFAIGAGDKIVGVVSGSDYPMAAQKIPQIGTYSGIDLEKVIALHPDLIVTWSHTFSRQLSVLKKFNIPIYTTEPHYLEDIPRTMKNLGKLTGTDAHASQVAKSFLKRLLAISKRYEQQQPVNVFYQLGSYSLMTVNKDSWINQVITLCGGRNIFANVKSKAAEVSWEAIVTANPAVILTDATNSDWQKRFEKHPEILAVKNNLLFWVNPDWIDRAGPRVLDAADHICKDLQHARKALS